MIPILTPPASIRPTILQPIVGLTVLSSPQAPRLASPEAFSVLTTIWRISAEFDGWNVGAFVLMPDHLHLFARATTDARPLHRWIENWKSISERRLRSTLGLKGPLWKPEYVGFYLHWCENYQVECDYIAHNPVRSGLCATADEWQWKGTVFNLAD